MNDLPMDAVLCYVRGSFAYFTTAPLDLQLGDDWDDAPYEHNAGRPYPDHRENGQTVKHTVEEIAWEGCWLPPCEGVLNSRYSVEGINGGAVPWLRAEPWGEKDAPHIPAGTTLRRFIEIMQQYGGRVWLPLSRPAPHAEATR